MTVEIDQTLKTLRQNLLLWRINDEKWNRRKTVWEKRQVRRNARKRNRGREDLEEEKYRKSNKLHNIYVCDAFILPQLFLSFLSLSSC